MSIATRDLHDAAFCNGLEILKLLTESKYHTYVVYFLDSDTPATHDGT